MPARESKLLVIFNVTDLIKILEMEKKTYKLQLLLDRETVENYYLIPKMVLTREAVAIFQW